jgi:hypothetical protein
MVAQPVFRRCMAEPELHISGSLGLGSSLMAVFEISQSLWWSQSVRRRKVVDNESLATVHVGLPVLIEHIAFGW